MGEIILFLVRSAIKLAVYADTRISAKSHHTCPTTLAAHDLKLYIIVIKNFLVQVHSNPKLCILLSQERKMLLRNLIFQLLTKWDGLLVLILHM